MRCGEAAGAVVDKKKKKHTTKKQSALLLTIIHPEGCVKGPALDESRYTQDPLSFIQNKNIHFGFWVQDSDFFGQLLRCRLS